MADETPKVNADYSAILEQAQLDYAAASKKGGQAQKDSALKLAIAYIQVGTLQQSSELTREIQKIAPTLMDLLAKNQANNQKLGAEKSLELLKAQAEEKRKLLEKESKDLFDLAKAGSSATINLMATFKGFATLLQGFGIDTSEFIKFCDDKIAEEQRKIPRINADRLDDITTTDKTIKATTVSSTAADARLSAAADKSIKDILSKSPELIDQIIAVGAKTGKQLAPTTQDAATATTSSGRRQTASADIETTRVIKAIQDGIGIKTDVDLQAIVKSSAASDKKSNTVSASDWAFMETKISMGVAMKGEAANEAEAKVKAHQIIEQIRAKATMGAPTLEMK
jgi:hypothetical protein